MSRTLQPEDRIAHYRVIGPLGAGGMGEVYLVQDEKLERNVALKVMPFGAALSLEKKGGRDDPALPAAAVALSGR